MTTIRPLQSAIVVEKEEDEKVSSGGIYLPVVDKERPRIAKVLAVGPGSYTEEGDFVDPGVEVGDRIAYTRAHEKTFKIGYDEITCVLAGGILGKVKDNGKKHRD